MMRRFTTGVIVGFLMTAGPAFAQAKAKATTPEIPFESVPNFFKLPAGLYMGEGTGVATNSRGHVFVYVRSGETLLFEFDQTIAYRRILQTKNFTDGHGLDWNTSRLAFYSGGNGPSGVHRADRFEQVDFVNNHGSLSGYVDGVL